MDLEWYAHLQSVRRTSTSIKSTSGAFVATNSCSPSADMLGGCERGCRNDRAHACVDSGSLSVQIEGRKEMNLHRACQFYSGFPGLAPDQVVLGSPRRGNAPYWLMPIRTERHSTILPACKRSPPPRHLYDVPILSIAHAWTFILLWQSLEWESNSGFSSNSSNSPNLSNSLRAAIVLSSSFHHHHALSLSASEKNRLLR